MSDMASFTDDLQFLQKHTEIIKLENSSGAAIALAPAWQGRVMTSTYQMSTGPSFGWINREIIPDGVLPEPELPEGDVRSKIYVFGGEERFWIGPEGGQYAYFFSPGADYTFDHWNTPAAIDTDSFQVVESSSSHATFQHSSTLINKSGFNFNIGFSRRVDLLSDAQIQENLGINLAGGVKAVGYQTTNSLTNNGDHEWTPETGMPSIWMLGMYAPSPATTIVIPVGEAETPIVNDYVFGEAIPADHLVTKGNHIFMKGDGTRRGKIGVDHHRSKGIAGSYDANAQVLTIVTYTPQDAPQGYVNSFWEDQEKPFGGDVINAYNDGPAEPGADPLGPFYELETSSPAAALKPTETITHKQQTYHINGSEAELSKLTEQLLGIGLDAVKNAFSGDSSAAPATAIPALAPVEPAVVSNLTADQAMAGDPAEPPAPKEDNDQPSEASEEPAVKVRFDELGLKPEVLKAVLESGYEHPTQIQRDAIPLILNGKDVIGASQTGTGKTAAFALPALCRIKPIGKPQVVVLEPTRELAHQVAEQFEKYGKHTGCKVALLYGGVKYGEQTAALQNGADIVVATPGRIIDHFYKGNMKFADVGILILDEVDRMLDMGFLPSVRKIINICPWDERQTLFFSATMPPAIETFAQWCLDDPAKIEVARSKVASTIRHAFYPVAMEQRDDLLLALIEEANFESLMVFTRTRMEADKITEKIKKSGKGKVTAMHSDIRQTDRTAALAGFKDGTFNILVCTDVAARGIDISSVTHVVNYRVPENAEDYVHRIGRTGRAARDGDACTILTADELDFAKAVEDLTQQKIERKKVKDFNYTYTALLDDKPSAPLRKKRPAPKRRRR